MSFGDTVLALLRWLFGAAQPVGAGQVDHAIEASWDMSVWAALLFLTAAGSFILVAYLWEQV